MRGSKVLATATALVIAACATQAPEPPTKYRLAVGQVEAEAGQGPEGSRPPLRVARVEGPSWARKRTMYYQLGFRTPAVLGWYGRSRWAEPPTVMLGRAVRSGLAASGRWRAILDADDRARAPLRLHVELRRFMQVFPEPDRVFGRLRARVVLLEEETGRLAGQRTFSYRVAGPSADAPGGVQALSEAATRFCEDLLSWLVERPSG